MTLRRAIRLTLFVTSRVCLPCQAIREQPRQPLFLTAESAPTPAFAGRRAHAAPFSALTGSVSQVRC